MLPLLAGLQYDPKGCTYVDTKHVNKLSLNALPPPVHLQAYDEALFDSLRHSAIRNLTKLVDRQCENSASNYSSNIGRFGGGAKNRFHRRIKPFHTFGRAAAM